MIRLLAKHPTAGNLLMAIFIVLGGLMATTIRRESMPDITPQQIEVRVLYPGASAEDVEETICGSIEEALDGVPSIDQVTSQAREGVGIVTVEMSSGGDFVTFKGDIVTEVDAITSFPEDAEDPIVTQLGRNDVVMAILVGGPMDSRDLLTYCEQVESRLRRLPAVSTVEIEGFSDRQLRVELEGLQLVKYGLSVSDIAQAIASESVDRPVGNIGTSERELSVRFTERRRTPRELESLVIREGAKGGEVTLGQLGRVRDLFEDAEDRVEIDGQRVGRIVVKKTKMDDTLSVSAAVKEFVEDERKRAPAGVQLTMTEDGSVGLVNQLSMVLTNGWQGMLLVFFTLWLFFTPRLGFWVVMGLPVSFLGAFILMPMFGMTINTMTLVGLLLALGILMDDAIVIAENMMVHLHKGKSAMQAAVDATTDVLPGIFSSFLTTVCMLGPLAFVEGDIGTVLGAVPVVLILVLAVSLVEAFCILPGHLGHALRNHAESKQSAFRAGFDRMMDWTRESIIGRTVDLLVRFRYLATGVTAALLIGGFGLLASGRLAFQAFPATEGDVLVARILMPAGTPLGKTRNVVSRVLEGLEATEGRLSNEQPEGRKLIQQTNTRFNFNATANESGPHLATVSVDLLTTEERGSRIDDIKRIWLAEIGPLPDVLTLTLSEPGGSGPAGRAIDIRILGEDLDELDTAAAEMIDWFAGFDGVSNVTDDLRRGKDELRLTVKEGSRALGLTASAMADQVGAAFLGRTADELQIGKDTFEVDVRLRPTDRDALDDLSGFRLALPGGGEVSLGTVADIQSGSGWSRIAHVDGRRAVTVTGDIDARVSNTDALFAAFAKEYLPLFQDRYPTLDLDLEGETAEGSKTMGSMLRGMLMGLLGVFVLLSLQFGTYSEPLVVMVAIPLTLIGVIGGHMLLDYPFTLPSLLGYIALGGVVVNDSILLVTFTKRAIGKGQDAMAAATQASRSRFRAVFLTSATTVVGLVPLLFESSVQAQMLKGLVISVTFGMIASTILVLFIVPCLYGILDDLGLTRGHSEESHA
ncbi:MAG: efflux RND transporter permease subunit [bacterium]|nr:efflux RND transporter permease subunit [bacterium]